MLTKISEKKISESAIMHYLIAGDLKLTMASYAFSRVT